MSIDHKYKFKGYPRDLDIREFFLRKSNRTHCLDTLKGKMQQEDLEDLLCFLANAVQHDRKH